jgi:DNA-binding response OmpR family regulator
MASTGTRRILVVEDQAITRDLVTMVLRNLGYAVDTVGTAEAALRRLPSGAYSLVVLDRSLPDVDGTLVLARLRAGTGPAARVPVVLLDDAEDDEKERRALAAGAQACLAKPVQIDRLLSLVRSLTRDDRRPAPRPASTAPVIDDSHLRGFTDGEPQLERELAALFVSTARQYVERMRQALETGEGWSNAAHALKGASANLGARRVAELAAIAEHGEPDPATLETLAAGIEDVRAYFEHRAGAGP